MPYITPERRKIYDAKIQEVINELRFFAEHGESIVGDVNYLICRLACESLKPQYGPWRYNDLNALIGVLTCAKDEINRQLVAPYEDACIERNGNLPVFEGN